MTKHSKLRFISVLIVAVILLLCAVIVTKSRPKGYENTAFAMDTYVSETIYGAKSSGVLSYIDELDKKLSAYNKDSEIYKLNESGSLNVSLDTLSLINEGIKYTNDCDGIFDISLFPVTSLWGIGTDNPKVPKSEEIETALKSVGIENITVDDNTVTLKNGAGIDLGGIAKGYACDKAYEIYKQNKKIKSAVLSFGSSILLYGKPNKDSFSVALRNPDNAESSLGTLTIGECFVSTSGGYERYFTADGKTYSHIFNTKTGYPAESEYKSVTIISQSGALGDYLSTAIYAGGNSALSLIPDSCSYILVDNENKIHISKNFSGKFSLSDTSFEVIYE